MDVGLQLRRNFGSISRIIIILSIVIYDVIFDDALLCVCLRCILCIRSGVTTLPQRLHANLIAD